MAEEKEAPKAIRELAKTEVNPESLNDILDQIAFLREQKGTSENLINFIFSLIPKVENTGNLSAVVQLWQEIFLCGQHMVMEEKSREEAANLERSKKGFQYMLEAAEKMKAYQNSDINPVIKALIFRYLGRLADYQNKPAVSARNYKIAYDYFNEQAKPEDHYNRLELGGMLSFAQLNLGKVDEGLSFAERILTDFESTTEGADLKENSFYTWTVWISGIYLRTAEYILSHNLTQKYLVAKDFLQKVETILLNNKLQPIPVLRIDEFKSVKELLEKKMMDNTDDSQKI